MLRPLVRRGGEELEDLQHHQNRYEQARGPLLSDLRLPIALGCLIGLDPNLDLVDHELTNQGIHLEVQEWGNGQNLRVRDPPLSVPRVGRHRRGEGPMGSKS